LRNTSCIGLLHALIRIFHDLAIHPTKTDGEWNAQFAAPGFFADGFARPLAEEVQLIV
jgi:hypothetical protein